MKRFFILFGFISAFVLVFAMFEGVFLIISLCVLFPLFFFYCPLIFMKPKEEEKTDEKKKEDEGRFGRWY